MNCSQLALCILAYTKALPDSEAKSDLLRFATILREEKNRSIAKLVENFSAILDASTHTDEKSPSDQALDVMMGLAEVTSVVGTKSSVNDMNLLITFVRDSGAMSLRALLSIIRPEPLTVQEYAAELRATAGDNAAFQSVVERVKKDKSLSVADISEIANLFTEVVKKRSGKAAIEAIQKKQQYYVEAKQSREATNGKSAA